MAATDIIDPGILNTALAQFTAAAALYAPEILIDSARVLTACAMVYFCYLIASKCWGSQFNDLAWNVMTGLFRIGVLNTVIGHAWLWGNAITVTGAQIGQDLTGLSPAATTPSGVFGMGANIISAIWDARSLGMWFHIGEDVILMLTSIAALVIFAVVSLYYLWILLEAAYVVLFGPIFIAFSALEWTWESLFAWAGEVLSVTIKLLAVITMISIGTAVGGRWVADFGAAGTTINLNRQMWANTALIEALLLGFLAMGVPFLVGKLIRSHFSGVSQLAQEGAESTMHAIRSGGGVAGAAAWSRNPVQEIKTVSTAAVTANSRFVQSRLRGATP